MAGKYAPFLATIAAVCLGTTAFAAPMTVSTELQGQNSNGIVTAIFKGVDGDGDGYVEDGNTEDIIAEARIFGTLFDFVPENPCVGPDGCEAFDLDFSFDLQTANAIFAKVATDLSDISFGLLFQDTFAEISDGVASITEVYDSRFFLTDTRDIDVELQGGIVPLPAAGWAMLTGLAALAGAARWRRPV